MALEIFIKNKFQSLVSVSPVIQSPYEMPVYKQVA